MASQLATYPINGNNEIDKPVFRHSALDAETPENEGLAGQARNDGRVYINETQYFDNVPVEAWNFYIGGYQPAQKWLKDRKGRTLGFEDILHYQRIVCVLKATGEVMEEVDKVFSK